MSFTYHIIRPFKVFDLMFFFSVSTNLYNQQHSLRISSPLQKETLYLLAVTEISLTPSLSSLPPALGNH